MSGVLVLGLLTGTVGAGARSGATGGLLQELHTNGALVNTGTTVPFATISLL